MTATPALIPAAGEGTRLRPVTRYLSKPMLPVGSEPVVHFSLREALEAGCSPVVVVRSSGDDDLKQYVRAHFGDDVQLTVQPESRGLADALKRGYDQLDDSPDRCAVLLPDNVVMDGGGIAPLLEYDHQESVLGTTLVSEGQAPYFGNSGDYESTVIDETRPVERIESLQEKGGGHYGQRYAEWPNRRSVARNLLTKEFFERVDEQDPDPQTGEIDDVPILRAMVQSSTVLGVPVDGTIHDMGTPDRYLRLCSLFHERNNSETKRNC